MEHVTREEMARLIEACVKAFEAYVARTGTDPLVKFYETKEATPS